MNKKLYTRLDLLNLNEVTRNLKTVKTNRVDRMKGEFHKDSLFDPRIFGTENDYTCLCGTHYRPNDDSEIVYCEHCGAPFVDSSSRRETWAKIELPIPIIHPFLYHLVKNKYSDLLKESYSKISYYVFDNVEQMFYKFNNDIDPALLNKEKSETTEEYDKRIYESRKKLSDQNKELLFDLSQNENMDFVIKSNGEKELKIYNGLDYLYKKLYILLESKESLTFYDKILKTNKDSFLTNNILVMPCDLRPIGSDESIIIMDEVNTPYQNIILNCIHAKKDFILTIENRFNVIRTEKWITLQRKVEELTSHIFKKIQGKEGMLRSGILGKRVDFSGRAVIIVDPTLPIDGISMPYFMALELFKMDIVYALDIMMKDDTSILEIYDYVNKVLKNESFELYDIVHEVAINKLVLLNRQPSLHRGSIISFRIDNINKDKAIKINPNVCPPFNADFDGDQMACYIFNSIEAKKEAEELLYVKNNIINSNLGVQFLPEQDAILGIFTLTDEHGPYGKKVIYNDIETTEGRIMFNDLIKLPEFYNEKINKKKLYKIFNKVFKEYGDECLDIINNVTRLGFEMATKYPISMDLDGLIKSNTSIEKKYEIYANYEINDDMTDEQKEEIINNQIIKNYEAEKEFLENGGLNNSPYIPFIESGARGNQRQFKQLFLAKGYLSNSNNEIIKDPVKHSTVDGLNKYEYHLSCIGARKGIADTADEVQVSGYLTRRLVYALTVGYINKDVEDCGTSSTLNVEVTSDNHFLFIRRNILTENGIEYLYDEKDTEKYIGHVIQLRSPMYCKCKDGICKKCAGEIYKDLKSYNIGTIAAQTFGERATQLILRTFHESGAANIGKKTGNNDIVSQLGHVIHLLASKSEKLSTLECLNTLKMIYGKFDILHIYYEILISQVFYIFNKDNSKYYQYRLYHDHPYYFDKYIKMSIDSIPSLHSWVNAFGYHSNFGNLIKGFYNPAPVDNLFSQIITDNFQF